MKIIFLSILSLNKKAYSQSVSPKLETQLLSVEPDVEQQVKLYIPF